MAKISKSMFQSTFGVENYRVVVFHSENLLTVFKIIKHFIWALNEQKIIF